MRPRLVGDAAFVHRWQIWAIASLTFETESSSAWPASSHLSMASLKTASQNSAYESISESSTGGSSRDLRPDEALVSEAARLLGAARAHRAAVVQR